MELLEYFTIIKKRLKTIIIITVSAALLSGILSLYVIAPVYEGKVTIIVGRASNTDTEKLKYDDILMYQKLVKTYAELVKSRLVIEDTISALKYNTTYENIEERLKVTSKGDTQVLEISIRDKSAEMAAQLANAISKTFLEKAKLIMDSSDLKIMDDAIYPEKPVTPNLTLNIALAVLLGFTTSLIIVLLIEYLDNTLKTESDVEEHLGITILASIPCSNNPIK